MPSFSGERSLQFNLDGLLCGAHQIDVPLWQGGGHAPAVSRERPHELPALVVDAHDGAGSGLFDDKPPVLRVDFRGVSLQAVHAAAVLLEGHVQERVFQEFRRGEAVVGIQAGGVVRAVERDGVDAPPFVGGDAHGACLAIFGLHFHASAPGLLDGEVEDDFFERDFHGERLRAHFHFQRVRGFRRGFAAVGLRDGHRGRIAVVRPDAEEGGGVGRDAPGGRPVAEALPPEADGALAGSLGRERAEGGRHVVGFDDVLEVAPILGILIQRLAVLGDAQRGVQVGTYRECGVNQFRRSGRIEGEGGQALTVEKGSISNGGQPTGQGDRGQAITVLKGVGFDGGHSVGNVVGCALLPLRVPDQCALIFVEQYAVLRGKIYITVRHCDAGQIGAG